LLGDPDDLTLVFSRVQGPHTWVLKGGRRLGLQDVDPVRLVGDRVVDPEEDPVTYTEGMSEDSARTVRVERDFLDAFGELGDREHPLNATILLSHEVDVACFDRVGQELARDDQVLGS
jgi:hypothetical protein